MLRHSQPGAASDLLRLRRSSRCHDKRVGVHQFDVAGVVARADRTGERDQVRLVEQAPDGGALGLGQRPEIASQRNRQGVVADAFARQVLP